jgi:hypothetical protein
MDALSGVQGRKGGLMGYGVFLVNLKRRNDLRDFAYAQVVGVVFVRYCREIDSFVHVLVSKRFIKLSILTWIPKL